jgi:16S rRNA C967 or C1407 C5-methylase (RsmB/RsmF family)
MDNLSKYRQFLSYSLKNIPVNAKDLLDNIQSSETLYSIRINNNKLNTEKPLGFTPVKWCDSAYYLDKKLAYTFDPWWHSGVYYVQEASSMFLHFILENITTNQHKKVLDISAAPGGKATLLSSFFDDSSLIVANEVIRSRAEILKENILKWGRGNVMVTQNNPADFSGLQGFFDLIVVDAPCSGEGLFRKDSNAINHWSPENVNFCAARQRKILSEIWPALKEDGFLIYSTCTYNTKENEENIEWLKTQCNFTSVSLPLPKDWGVLEHKEQDIVFYRFFPHITKGEGFSVTVLQKKETTPAKKIKPKKNKPLLPHKQLSLNNAFVYNFNGQIISSYLPDSDWNFLTERLNVRYLFNELGEWKQKSFIPSHALALGPFLKQFDFPLINLSYEQIIRYLKKEPFVVNNLQTGWNIAAFRDVPAGFMKNNPNSVNNYFPKNYRIRTSLPSEKPLILADCV